MVENPLPKLEGWPALVVYMISYIGVPSTLMLLCVVYVVRPVVASHVQLLNVTSSATERMADSIESIDETIDVIRHGDYPSQEFRDKIYAEHAIQENKIDGVKDDTEEILKEVKP